MSAGTKEVDTVPDPFADAEVDTLDDELGAVAAQGLGDDGPAQQPLVDGPEPGAKVTFVGMNYNDVDETLRLGDEVTFTVTGTVVGEGTEIMAVQHRRKLVKVRITDIETA